MAELFLKGLEFLRKHFEKRADADLCCYLFEYPVIGDSPSALPWGDKRPEAFKWELGTFYRNFKFVEGTPRLLDRGAKRELYFFGPEKLRKEFLRLAGEAGTLISGVPEAAFPAPIPDETLRTTDEQLRWCYFVFDLAWAGIKGSPLRASEKFAWNGDGILPLTKLPELRQWNGYEWGKEIAERAARVPDPPSWFSDIDDLWRASVYAVDILLATVGRSDADQPVAIERGDFAGPTTGEVVSKITNGKGRAEELQNDIGHDKQKKTEKKRRSLTKEARDCIREYKRLLRIDGEATMKSVVGVYIDAHGGSVDGLMRRLNDHSDEWKKPHKADKKPTKERQT